MISESFFKDNMEGMASFPDDFFDLGIIDTEYGINAPNMQMGQNLNRNDGWQRKESTAVKLKGRLNSGGGKLKNRLLNTSNIDWDNSKPAPEFWQELFRVTKNQIIWGGNYFTDNLPESRCWIVWDKCQPWENFSQVELAWTSFDMPAKLFKYSNTGGGNHEKKIHPTQKPIKLYDYCLHHFAKHGFKILDTNMGSQSSRISAHKNGFDYWGFENNEEYFIEGNKRFLTMTAQSSLIF